MLILPLSKQKLTETYHKTQGVVVENSQKSCTIDNGELFSWTSSQEIMSK